MGVLTTPAILAEKQAQVDEIAELLGDDMPRREDALPPFVPTDLQRQQVELLYGLGLTMTELASIIINPETDVGISQRALRKHFGPQLDQGKGKVKARVLTSLVAKACSKTHPQAAICAMFIAKCQFGWRQEDKLQVDITAKAGVLVAPGAVTPAEWIAAEQEANRNKSEPGLLTVEFPEQESGGD